MKQAPQVHHILLLLTAVTLVGCGSTEPLDAPATSVSSQDNVGQTSDMQIEELPIQSQASLAVDAHLKKSGSIAFDSHDGQSDRPENGLTLILLPDGIAKLRYDGQETETTSGNYVIDGSGQLQLDFGPDDPWLPMPMSIENEIVFVNAPEKEEIIRAALQAGIQRSEITDDDLKAAFEAWPLRQATSPN